MKKHLKIFSFEMPEQSPGFLLWQTTTVWQRLVKKALKPFGIAHAQFVIMAIALWAEYNNQQELTQIDIARFSKLDIMIVSKSLKLLAQRGYIKRTESTYDTRAKSVVLTIDGKELIKILVPVVEKVDKEFFEALSQNDQNSFIKMLSGLVAHGTNNN